MTGYNTTVEINVKPENVFKAITQELGSWWGNQTCLIDKAGMEFKVHWNEPWYQFEVIEFILNKKVVWKCTDANQIINELEGVQKEWVGTEIHWNIKKVDDNKSILIFEHKGLIPEFICFDFCSKSWEHFLKSSLKEYCEI